MSVRIPGLSARTSADSEPATQQRRLDDTGRLVWIDSTKGFLIVLVVLWHSSLWMFQDINQGAEGVWRTVGLFLGPIRMPLFFFLSGYLAVGALTRRLADSRRRTVGFGWIYGIWTLLFLARQFIPGASPRPPDAAGTVAALLLPTSFWYLWALPVYFLISWVAIRLCGRFAPWLVIPMLVLALCSPLTHDWSTALLVEPFDSVKFPSVFRNLVWFYAGSQLRPLWDRAVARATWRRLVSAAGAYVALYVVVELTQKPTDDGSWMVVPLSVVAVVGAAQLIGLASWRSRPAAILQRVGRHTLPIYVLHLFAISALAAIVRVSHLQDYLSRHAGVFSVVLPPIIAITVIPAVMVLAAGIRRSKVSWLLEPPRVLVGAARVRKQA